MHRICFTAGVLALCAVLGAVNSRSAKADDQPAKDIVDTAVGAGQFKTLVTAVKAAELVETLKGKGPFTVFAPTDEAFAKVPQEKLDALLKADFEALCEKVETHLRKYGGRIFNGEVAVAPFRIGNQTACDYCDFRAVCRFDPWTQPFRALRPPPQRAKEMPLKKRQTVRVRK